MYVARQLTEAILVEIGRQFGGRHHNTVLYSINKIEALRRMDAALNPAIVRLMEAAVVSQTRGLVIATTGSASLQDRNVSGPASQGRKRPGRLRRAKLKANHPGSGRTRVQTLLGLGADSSGSASARPLDHSSGHDKRPGRSVGTYQNKGSFRRETRL